MKKIIFTLLLAVFLLSACDDSNVYRVECFNGGETVLVINHAKSDWGVWRDIDTDALYLLEDMECFYTRLDGK